MVEDDPRDVELSLTALEDYNLANEVVVVRDGEEALDYLAYRGTICIAPRRQSGGHHAGPEIAQGRWPGGIAAG